MLEPQEVITRWDDMAAWLVEALDDMPRAAVLDLGPVGYDPAALDPAAFDSADPDASDDVPNVQVQMLRGGAMLLRLSTEVMEIPLLSGYSVPRSALNRWHYDDAFPDCTHGYLMSRSSAAIADICVTWFRDRCGIAGPQELGCGYTTPTELPQAG